MTREEIASTCQSMELASEPILSSVRKAMSIIHCMDRGEKVSVNEARDAYNDLTSVHDSEMSILVENMSDVLTALEDEQSYDEEVEDDET